MPRDDLGPAGDQHLLDVAAHQHRTVAVGGRYRVVVAVVAHQRQGRDPPGLAVTCLIGRTRPRLQGGEVTLQPLADALGMAADAVVEPIEAAPLEMRIEGRKVGDGRHRHQEVAPGVADQALHLAQIGRAHV